MIRLFDVENGVVIPTEHCYMLSSLKAIMEYYPERYMSVYAYLFYMTCPNPVLNPFFEVVDIDKEELILREVNADFSPDEILISTGLAFCRTLYETPSLRAYTGIKIMLDNLADYMARTSITHGRDGNITALANVAAKFEAIRQSYKGAFKDLMDEQKSTARGGTNMAYDQQ
jgi:hypothetical protein